MKDIFSLLRELRRPRLLIRTARIGAQEYRRDPQLYRLLGYGELPRPASALLSLMEMETLLNDARKREEASYSVSRHVEVLVAMMGEARLLRSLQPVA